MDLGVDVVVVVVVEVVLIAELPLLGVVNPASPLLSPLSGLLATPRSLLPLPALIKFIAPFPAWASAD